MSDKPKGTPTVYRVREIYVETGVDIMAQMAEALREIFEKDIPAILSCDYCRACEYCRSHDVLRASQKAARTALALADKASQ